MIFPGVSPTVEVPTSFLQVESGFEIFTHHITGFEHGRTPWMVQLYQLC